MAKTTFRTYASLATAQQKAEEHLAAGRRVVALRKRVARVLNIRHDVWELEIESESK
jgi:hypothetical protein